MKTKLGYKKTGNKIKHASKEYNYYVTGMDWCSSYASAGRCVYSGEGGYGEFETDKQTWTLKQDYKVNTFDTGPLEHKLTFGWEADFARAKYQRDKDTYNKTYRLINASNLSAEQYLRTYTLYPARNVNVGDNTYAAYLEDAMRWKRLSATIGV